MHCVQSVAAVEPREINKQSGAGTHPRTSSISHEICGVALRGAGRRRTIFPPQHPRHAESWELECVQRLSAVPEVQRVHGDQCQFGAQIQSGSFKGHPTKKPTGFFTNSPKFAEALAQQCTGLGGECSRRLGGRHRHITGRHAAEAAKYPKGLC